MDPKLDDVAEYKGVRDEIAFYQQEMHRTWLWAIIPAGAIYTWIALHIKDLTNVPRAVWFIPAGFVLLCFVRYLGFWYRIEGLARYQCLLEKGVFAEREACGIATWNLKRHALPNSASFLSKLWSYCRHPTAFIFYASSVWLVLLACCILLSRTLSAQSWAYDPKTPPPLSLSDAYAKALLKLDKATNRFHCISASCVEMSNTNGWTGWTFWFSITNGQRARI